MMPYPKCPRCREGRMVPMFMSGPSCDRACEREATAAVRKWAYKLSVGDRVMIRRVALIGGTVCALGPEPGVVQVLWDDGLINNYCEDSLRRVGGGNV